MLDDDNKPIKDVIAVGLQNLVEGNKNPLSDYNEAFRNLQAQRQKKPAIPGLAKEKKDATDSEATSTRLFNISKPWGSYNSAIVVLQ